MDLRQCLRFRQNLAKLRVIMSASNSPDTTLLGQTSADAVKASASQVVEETPANHNRGSHPKTHLRVDPRGKLHANY